MDFINTQTDDEPEDRPFIKKNTRNSKTETQQKKLLKTSKPWNIVQYVLTQTLTRNKTQISKQNPDLISKDLTISLEP